MLGSLTLPPLPEIVTTDWQSIKDLYSISKYPHLHLNSGSAGIMPTVVQDKVAALTRQMNENPPYEMWDSWAELRYTNGKRLAAHINAKHEEVTVVRNTTEAMNLVIFGYPFTAQDHVVYGSQEYPYGVGSLKQAQKKHGFDLSEITMHDVDEVSDEEIISRYKAALRPNTKLILISYVSFREGRILPIKAITELAHANGTEVLLDAAHAYAHFIHDVKDLGIDYYATSLHKWLTAPHGTGLLYIKEDHIAKLLPPLPSINDEQDIKKFDHLGTRPFQLEIGISYALTFQDTIGFEKKANRLLALTQYWTDRIVDMPGVKLHTPIGKGRCGAVAAFSIEGRSSTALLKTLMDDYGIHTKVSGYPQGKSFLRVSPNLFTLESDLDIFVSAIQQETTK